MRPSAENVGIRHEFPSGRHGDRDLVPDEPSQPAGAGSLRASHNFASPTQIRIMRQAPRRAPAGPVRRPATLSDTRRRSGGPALCPPTVVATSSEMIWCGRWLDSEKQRGPTAMADVSWFTPGTSGTWDASTNWTNLPPGESYSGQIATCRPLRQHPLPRRTR